MGRPAGGLVPSTREATRVLAARFAAEYLERYKQAGMPAGSTEDAFVEWARRQVIHELQATQIRDIDEEG